MNIWKKSNLHNIKNKKISYQSFDSSVWKKIILKKIKINLNRLNNNFTKYFLASSPLPLILLNYDKRVIDIADYGSGDQEILFQLINLKKRNTKINIDSIEVPAITKLLKKKIKKNIFRNIKINFINEFNFKKKYDLVHISDSLQYNLNWKDFLKRVISKKHNFIILNNLTAGNFNTYITEQKFYKKKLPYIFFNEKEVKTLFKSYNIYQYLFLNKIHNQFKEYPQKNFKKKDRLQYPKTLIFKKKI